VIVHSLRFRGLSTFREEVSIDFDALGPGIICLVGPKGAGKSTILEASLLGTLYRAFPYYKTSFIQQVTPGVRDAFAELVFSVDYDKPRYRALVQADPLYNAGKGKSEAYLFTQDSKPIGGPTLASFDEALARIFPVSEKFLIGSAFAVQRGRGSFFDLLPAEKKDFVMEMLGAEHFQRDSKAAGARAQSVLSALEGLRREIAAAEQSAERASTLDAAITEARLKHAAATAEARAGQAAAVAAEERRKAAGGAFDAARAIADRHAALGQEIERNETAIDEQRGRISALEDLLSLAGDVDAAVARVQAIDGEISDLRASDAALAARVSDVATAAARAGAEREALLANFKRLDEDLKAAATARRESAGYEQAASELATKEHARDRAIAEVDALDNQIDAVEAAANAEADAKQRRAVLEAKRDALSERTGLVQQLEEPKNPLCSRCPAVRGAFEAQRALAAIESELAALPVIEGIPAQDARRALGERIKSAQIGRQKTQAAADAAANAVRSLEQRRDAGARVEELEERVAANRETGKQKRSELDSLNAERADLQAQLDSIHEGLKQKDADRTEASKVASRASQVATAQERKAAAEAVIADAAASIEAARAEVRAVVLADLASLAAAVDAADIELAQAQDARDRGAEGARLAEMEVAGLEGERRGLGEPAEQLKVLREREACLADDAADWALLERSLGRQGVQALEVDAAGPGVTSISNELLESCYGPRFSIAFETVALKKDGDQKAVFDVRIIDSEMGRVGKKGSGGEQAILDEAQRLGFATYNTRRSEVPIRSLWRDETAGALDPESADQYVAMLRKAREIGGYHQIFFVAHQPAVYEQADARIFVKDGRVWTDAMEQAA